jgi:hypothetical protein
VFEKRGKENIGNNKEFVLKNSEKEGGIWLFQGDLRLQIFQKASWENPENP